MSTWHVDLFISICAALVLLSKVTIQVCLETRTESCLHSGCPSPKDVIQGIIAGNLMKIAITIPIVLTLLLARISKTCNFKNGVLVTIESLYWPSQNCYKRLRMSVCDGKV